MNGVWILVAWVANGHGSSTPVPTTEFARESLCQQAIVKILPDSDGWTKEQRQKKLTCVNVMRIERK